MFVLFVSVLFVSVRCLRFRVFVCSFDLFLSVLNGLFVCLFGLFVLFHLVVCYCFAVM